MQEILLLRPKIGFGMGGAEFHAAMVAKKLIERGYRVGIIAHQISFPKDLLRELNLYPVKYSVFGSILKQLLFIHQVKKNLSKLSNYKLISFFRYPYFSDLFILCDPMIAFLIDQRKPFLGKVRLRYKIMLELEKSTLSQARKVISLFTLGKKLIEKYYPEMTSKTFICYRGVDLQRFNPNLKSQKGVLRKAFGFSEGDFLLLFVGYDVRRKGLDLLLKIMPELPKNIKLLVAGKEGVSSERVIYLGKVKEVEKLYALADFFVLPTQYDPGALATLEALASGTPVLTTPYDGTSEFVKENFTGWVVKRNPEIIKETILKAFLTNFDPEKIASTVKALTWDNYIDCLLNHLEIE